RDDLIREDALLLGDLLEQLGLALGVHDGPHEAAGEAPVTYLQGVGEGVVDAEALAQGLGGDIEPSGENRGAEAQPAEDPEETFGAVGEGKGLRNLGE